MEGGSLTKGERRDEGIVGKITGLSNGLHASSLELPHAHHGKCMLAHVSKNKHMLKADCKIPFNSREQETQIS